ncbi:TPA: hypothetical protein KO123_002315 [Clostridioides difficile]|uniref:hypothetical protein n=1 Tax=Clostridioides difficile TaxID=1496 RepID=UPI000B3C7A45|nr:hypothetical protein [Clostridioides difficile]MCJ0089200.1 hypothetical protein [Clostridioides difficile]MCJ0314070.1 hypothetical protein [Clostridioides difficile]MDB3148234.1 hypothetical protein [Clostridioides difficile]MDB3182433.1 hypothetical protein [Clostridioides difficile]MDB3201445.1 hypothetical protein [Clostridioides difficile]
MKYRKKPIIIDAKPYKEGLEDGFKCIRDNCIYKNQQLNKCSGCKLYKPYIKTLEGDHYILETDFIITGVKGERYPCKKDIFEMTYERVED